jgi:hypothetical protein
MSYLDRDIADVASEVERDVESARRKALEAQRSAAASLRESAEAQERVAKMYLNSAENGLFHDDEVDREDDLDHVVEHRQFAEDDRRMAEWAQRSAGEHLGRNPARPPG